MVSTAVCSEVRAACIHSSEPKKLSYQRVDQCSGGNSRYWLSEKDIGITISVGSTSRIMVMTAKT